MFNLFIGFSCLPLHSNIKACDIALQAYSIMRRKKTRVKKHLHSTFLHTHVGSLRGVDGRVTFYIALGVTVFSKREKYPFNMHWQSS